MAIVTTGGEVFRIGQADTRFSIQSISKLFACTMAFRLLGDDLWKRVGREPSGTPFNSLVQLEAERGKPRNPFINAGALVVTDVLCRRFVQAETALVEFHAAADRRDYDRLRFARRAIGVAECGSQPGHGAFHRELRQYGNAGPCGSRRVLPPCAISMSCVELAKAALFLSNHGVVPSTGERILDSSSAKRLSALMLTCGTYDAAGDFVYRVGLPAKSGVGGGIVAVLPGEMAVCVWSPGLDSNGNSLAGVLALEWLTTYTGQSIF